MSAASGGSSEPKQGQRSQSARGFCPRSTMRVPQPDIIEHFGNADAVPQLPERCLSRKAGIMRCCPWFFIQTDKRFVPRALTSLFRGELSLKAIPHNSKCRYSERGAAAAKPKAQIILDAAKVSAASGGSSEPKQGQRSQSARGFCPRSTMRVPQPDIIEHFGNADAVPQPPKRCLSRKAGIVRCCLNFKRTNRKIRILLPCLAFGIRIFVILLISCTGHVISVQKSL